MSQETQKRGGPHSHVIDQRTEMRGPPGSLKKADGGPHSALRLYFYEAMVLEGRISMAYSNSLNRRGARHFRRDELRIYMKIIIFLEISREIQNFLGCSRNFRKFLENHKKFWDFSRNF